MAPHPKKSNPFDLKYARSKFDVVKPASAGKAAQKRGRAQAIRQNTLLKQIESRRSNNQVIGLDRVQPSSSSYERDMHRNSSGSKKKSTLYDLEDEINLTHGGMRLEDLDEEDLGGAISDSDDDNGPDLNAEFANPDKTKQEIMREVIAKSKFYKAERQRMKEENLELMAELDEDFADVITSLESRTRSDPAPTGKQDPFESLLNDISMQPRIASKPIVDAEQQAQRDAKKRSELELEQESRMADDNEFKFEKSTSSDTPEVHKLNATLLTMVNELLESYRDKQAVNRSYKALLKKLQENNSLFVDLGRILRAKIQESLDRFVTSPFLPQGEFVVMLRLINALFSTSDYHHLIVTPATLLSCMYLYDGVCKRAKHVLTGLEIAEILIQFQQDSKRFVPEVFSFVSTALQALGYGTNSIFPYRHVARSIVITSDERQVLVSKCIQVLNSAASVYGDYQCFPQLFSSFVHQVGSDNLFPDIKLRVDTFEQIPLRLQAHKPIALQQLEPELDIDKGFDHKRSDIQRLKKASKRELRGAKRELRRDAAFVAKHQGVNKAKASQEYKDRMNRIMGSIANEE